MIDHAQFPPLAVSMSAEEIDAVHRLGGSIDVNGYVDKSTIAMLPDGIEYFGLATPRPNGKWGAFARIDSLLVTVECTIRPLKERT